MPTDLQTLLAILILGLGTARLSALVALDDITENLRDLIFHWFPPEDNAARGWYYQTLMKATERERMNAERWATKRRQVVWTNAGEVMRDPSFIGSLTGCHKCISVWIAFANLGAYLLWPEPVVAFNAALAASFLSLALVGRYYR